MSGGYRGIRFSSILFRRDILDNVFKNDPGLFNPAFPTLDIAFFYECAYNGRLSFLDETMAVYRMQAESVSITRDLTRRSKFSMGCIEIYLHYYKKYSLPADFIRNHFRHSSNGPLMHILHSRDENMACRLREMAGTVCYNFSFGQKLILKSCHNRCLSVILKAIVAVKLQ